MNTRKLPWLSQAKLTAATLAAGMAVSPAYAASPSLSESDYYQCRDQAQREVSMSGNHTGSRAVERGANVIGAMIAGRNPEFALGGLLRGSVRDVGRDYERKGREIDRKTERCLRELKSERGSDMSMKARGDVKRDYGISR